MVHTRFNERETNPNPLINFVTALPSDTPGEQEAARQHLRALAAQVRPIMKSHGFSINSFEEYEYNTVFAGRNWEAGETVELVLRRKDGSFLPTFWLMSTFCHELAHIRHMHHGPTFQALWRQLRMEVRSLQDKGYYGDGYWSSGTRLSDSAPVGGQGIEPGDLPEYMCGGAQRRARPTAYRRRTNRTGPRTAKRRKAGTRVTSKTAFVGQGQSLAEGSDLKGTGFGKQAGSKRAREERAFAAEQRIRALKGSEKVLSAEGQPSPSALTLVSNSESDDEVEVIAETDEDRRKALVSSEEGADLQDLRSEDLWKAFNVSLEEDNTKQSAGSVPPPRSASSTQDRKGKHKADVADAQRTGGDAGKSEVSNKRKPSPGRSRSSRNLLQTQIQFKKEMPSTVSVDRETEVAPVKSFVEHDPPWSCLVCTLLNKKDHLACSACGTPRGEEVWRGS